MGFIVYVSDKQIHTSDYLNALCKNLLQSKL